MRRCLLAVLVIAACGGAPTRPATPSGAGGAGEMSWAETRRLIELFDVARFGRDPARRQELLGALGVRDEGADAQARTRTTDAVLDALLVRVDAVLAGDRLHAGAQAARVLLEHDRHPPARADLLARMAALRSLARGGGPLAAEAGLRLWSFCERALRDAVEAPPRDRPRVLAMCLYPLWSSDPEPYFDLDPARRPPPPEVARIAERMGELTAQVAAGKSAALAEIATRLGTELDTFLTDAESRGLLPAPYDPVALGVPLLGDPPLAQPYDGEPLIVVRDPTAAELAAFGEKMRALLELDGRGRAVLVLPRDAAARLFLDLSGMLRRHRAESVALAAGWRQKLRPPTGDYWFDRVDEGGVPRLGLLPLRLEPAALGARAGLGLVLSLTPRVWRIVSPSGAMPPIAVSADAAPARAALRAQLEMIFDAFPDESALSIAPDPAITVAALAEAVHAASRRADGTPLAAELALATYTAPGSRAGTLEERARRRAAARVTIVPDVLAGKQAATRRCYQDALDRDPSLRGTLMLALDGDKAHTISGPTDAKLAACVSARLGPAMLEGGIRSVRVELGS